MRTLKILTLLWPIAKLWQCIVFQSVCSFSHRSFTVHRTWCLLLRSTIFHQQIAVKALSCCCLIVNALEKALIWKLGVLRIQLWLAILSALVGLQIMHFRGSADTGWPWESNIPCIDSLKSKQDWKVDPLINSIQSRYGAWNAQSQGEIMNSATLPCLEDPAILDVFIPPSLHMKQERGRWFKSYINIAEERGWVRCRGERPLAQQMLGFCFLFCFLFSFIPLLYDLLHQLYYWKNMKCSQAKQQVCITVSTITLRWDFLPLVAEFSCLIHYSWLTFLKGLTTTNLSYNVQSFSVNTEYTCDLCVRETRFSL